MNRIENLIADANHVMNEIAARGLRNAAQNMEGWKMAAAGYASAENAYAGHGQGKAEWEVIIDRDGISIILRQYADNKRITRWAIGSDENVGRKEAEAAMERNAAEARPGERACKRIAKGHNAQPSIEQVAGEGFRPDGNTTYEQWDAMRRRLLTALDSYDNIEVVHGEYESAVYYGPSGRVVASWEQATGRCSIQTPDQVAVDLAASVHNYVKNAMRYSTTTISDMS